MVLHFVIFSLGRNGLYCYGFPNLRMRFCGMYGVPAALAIADAVGSGRTSRLTSIRRSLWPLWLSVASDRVWCAALPTCG